MFDNLFFKELGSLAEEAPKKVLGWEKQTACGSIAVQLAQLIMTARMPEKVGHQRAKEFLRAMVAPSNADDPAKDTDGVLLLLCGCFGAALHGYSTGFHTAPTQELVEMFCGRIVRACAKMLPDESRTAEVPKTSATIIQLTARRR